MTLKRKHYTNEHYSDLIRLTYSDEEIEKTLQLDAGIIDFALSRQRLVDLFVWL